LGLEDGVTWASSDNFTVSPTETNAIVHGFDNFEEFKRSGMYIGKDKYTILRGDKRVIMAKLGTGGAVITRTNRALVVGIYKNNQKYARCYNAVARVSLYMLGLGF